MNNGECKLDDYLGRYGKRVISRCRLGETFHRTRKSNTTLINETRKIVAWREMEEKTLEDL